MIAFFILFIYGEELKETVHKHCISLLKKKKDQLHSLPYHGLGHGSNVGTSSLGSHGKRKTTAQMVYMVFLPEGSLLRCTIRQPIFKMCSTSRILSFGLLLFI